MDLNAERVINDQIVPVTNESELMYIFSFGGPNEELYWSLPVFPGEIYVTLFPFLFISGYQLFSFVLFIV